MAGIFGSSTTAKQPTAIGSLQFHTAQRGGVIPLVYGACRVAPNMVDYDDFKSFQVNAQNASKGKGGGGGKSGKSQQQVTEYSASFIMATCQGPIGGTGLAWYDKFISGVAELDSINSIDFGADGQGADSYWASNHAYKALGYSGTMIVVFANRNLGPSATMPNFSFEIFGMQATAPNFIDCNPADVIKDFLTNPRYGAGFPLANLDTTSFDATNAASYSSYVRALGLWISISMETQQEAQQYLDTITKLTNSEVVWSGGLLKIIPRGETQVVGSITSNSSWTITLSGGDQNGGDTITVTISDPVFGTSTVSYTTYQGESVSDVGASLVRKPGRHRWFVQHHHRISGVSRGSIATASRYGDKLRDGRHLDVPVPAVRYYRHDCVWRIIRRSAVDQHFWRHRNLHAK